MSKITRMSNAPISAWPKPLLTTQVGLLLNSILGLPILEASEVAFKYTEKEARDFIEANLDLIDEKVI